jgi:hypothetical protein
MYAEKEENEAINLSTSFLQDNLLYRKVGEKTYFIWFD